MPLESHGHPELLCQMNTWPHICTCACIVSVIFININIAVISPTARSAAYYLSRGEMRNHLSVWDVMSAQRSGRAGWDGNFANRDDFRSILRNRNSHKLDKHFIWWGSEVLDSPSPSHLWRWIFSRYCYTVSYLEMCYKCTGRLPTLGFWQSACFRLDSLLSLYVPRVSKTFWCRTIIFFNVVWFWSQRGALYLDCGTLIVGLSSCLDIA